MHHLSEFDGFSLQTVNYVVFDDADLLFEMGFAEQLHKILTQLSENPQILIFTATIPSALGKFARASLRDPLLLRLNMKPNISPRCKLAFFTLKPEEKTAALLYLIREVINPNERILVFVSTKHHTEYLKSVLSLEGIESDICNGDMDLEAREITLSRNPRVLIVTDVAYRIMDIPLVDNVINWDYPWAPKKFVHRVCRVVGSGTAFSFVTCEDMPYFVDLHLFLSRPFKGAPMEEELLKDKDGVMAYIDRAIANVETVYGRFPTTVLEAFQDKIRDFMDSSSDLAALQRNFENAYRVYSMSKPLPSKESIRRVKYLPCEGLHPMFNASLGGQ